LQSRRRGNKVAVERFMLMPATLTALAFWRVETSKLSQALISLQ
jgi:hypothetical protein